MKKTSLSAALLSRSGRLFAFRPPAAKMTKARSLAWRSGFPEVKSSAAPLVDSRREHRAMLTRERDRYVTAANDALVLRGTLG
jgi:hypothetical protein